MAVREYRSTALHVDLYSPIATSPTWSKLTRGKRTGLTAMPALSGTVRMCIFLVQRLERVNQRVFFVRYGALGISGPAGDRRGFFIFFPLLPAEPAMKGQGTCRNIYGPT
jgi:hypothetical protein